MIGSLYVSLGNSFADSANFMDGRALAHAADALDLVAAGIGVSPVSDLYMLDCTIRDMRPAAEGLAIFGGYLNYVEQHPDSVPDCAGVVDDLKMAIGIIGKGSHWCLMIDYE